MSNKPSLFQRLGGDAAVNAAVDVGGCFTIVYLLCIPWSIAEPKDTLKAQHGGISINNYAHILFYNQLAAEFVMLARRISIP